ncbi:MAG: DUF4147 domain-containing protein, partial [Acidobacteria bacterium]|nr:DUF4147 domain-containing protein [Acidobacteriota bacterium]
MAVLNFKNLLLPSLVMPIVAMSLKELAPERAIGSTFFKDHGVETPVKRALFLGKCALPFFLNFAKFYPDIPSFVYSTKPVEKFSFKNAVFRYGDHPIPSKGNYEICRELKSWLAKINGDAVVFVSGGTSSLLFHPSDNVPYHKAIEIEKKLLKEKVSIKEINYVRMALSELRGGGIAKIISPYKFYGFVWCDVAPRDYKLVGSAPLGGVKIDLRAKALNILKKRGIKPDFEISEKKMFYLPMGCSITKIADGETLCKKVKSKLEENNVKCKIVKIK